MSRMLREDGKYTPYGFALKMDDEGGLGSFWFGYGCSADAVGDVPEDVRESMVELDKVKVHFCRVAEWADAALSEGGDEDDEW